MKRKLLDHVGVGLLTIAIVLILGWPVVSTLFAVIQDRQAMGLGLLDPAMFERGEVVRPAGLAFETMRLVFVTELIVLALGIPLALLLVRTNVWGRRLMIGLLALSAFVPLPLHATAWLGGFGSAGRIQLLGGVPILVGWAGAAFIHAMATLPWVVLLVGVGLVSVERELEESASLDMPGWMVAWRITLRRSLGAIMGSALAVAVLTVGEMTVTDLLRVRTYAEEAYIQFQVGRGTQAALAVTLPPLVVLGGLVLAMIHWLNRAEPARSASIATSARTWRLGRYRVVVSIMTIFFVGAVVGVPLVSLVWRAGRVGGMAAIGQGPRWSLAGLWGSLFQGFRESWGPIRQGATWAAVGAVGTVVFAWGLAWSARESRGWGVLTALVVALTLALPGPVAGMGLVLAYRYIDIIYDTPLILVFAHILRTLPYTLIVLWPAIRSIPNEYIEAAQLDGLGSWGIVRRVVLPLTIGPTFAAFTVSFVLALGELPAANLVAPPGVMTVTVTIWSLLHTGVESHLAGVGLVLIGLYALCGSVASMAIWFAYRRRAS